MERDKHRAEMLKAKELKLPQQEEIEEQKQPIPAGPGASQ